MIKRLNAEKNVQQHGFITVFNRGAFVARFGIAYFINGQLHFRRSPTITTLWDYTLNIPPKAKNIQFTVQIAVYFDTWRNIYSTKFDLPVEKCFKATGITLYANCDEVICPSRNTEILKYCYHR